MEKIAIVGCGLVGRAWAMVFARAGHPVKLFDSAPGAADKAVSLIAQGLEELNRVGLISEPAATVMKRVSTAGTLVEAVSDAETAARAEFAEIAKEDWVMKSLAGLEPVRAGRVVVHGELRAHEMEEVARAMRSIGLDPIMAEATARRMRWSADLGLKDRFGGQEPENYAAFAKALET